MRFGLGEAGGRGRRLTNRWGFDWSATASAALAYAANEPLTHASSNSSVLRPDHENGCIRAHAEEASTRLHEQAVEVK
jgi:hypothetical protein